ncbi:MAG TPA: ATP-dependent helicase HrpB [Gemmatimonadales bacterium]|nr:ATP-dependent helicase HrpB [Gemmatimonadales bacterium]
MRHIEPLPIEQALPALRAALRNGTGAVLQAPPGAGKTTRVPLALLDEPWLAGRRIVMLEPRRLAARAAARRMADTLEQRVGDTVGYRVRHESAVGPGTRIVVVTEGILTRMLQADPALEEFGLVAFDEFHERSIHADLGLALTLQSRAVLREDLRVLIMSATLEGGPVAALLGGAPQVTSEGRAHPVEVRHLARRAGTKLEPAVAAVVRQALQAEEGDLLVFLPGAGEIRRVEELLRGVDADVIPLHGNLSPDQQDRAILPGPPGGRKVVLATSIAETSLTIEGVRVVVDAGLSRVPRFSPRTGMTRLATVRVSRASAEQRRGRAGRLTPGVCYRLWSRQEDATLPERSSPEILQADLAPLALDLAAAGVRDPAELRWLDPPPPAAFSEARSLLAQLGALDASGGFTRHGVAMTRLALHPRLSHMVMKASELGDRDTACEIAALLTERDLLRRSEGVPEADIRTRLDLLRGTTVRREVDREALRRARAEVAVCRRGRGAGKGQGAGMGVGVLLGLAYPDRIAQRRQGQVGRFLLRNGLGASLDPQGLSREEYLVIPELDGKAPESRILVAAPISIEEIREWFGSDIAIEEVVAWDSASHAVAARRRERLGAIVLRDTAIRNPDPALVAGALMEGVRKEGLHVLSWDDGARRTRERITFIRTLDAGWPNVSDDALADSLEEWLEPHGAGLARLDDLARVDLSAALLDRLSWEQRAALDRLAPTHVTVPSGSRIPVDYGDPALPVLAVRLQELFGLTETPRVGGGAVPLTLHLLSPAGRPVQVTRDIAGFWRTTYFEVRKDLKGRYPKHHWPDDPLEAEPTNRVRPRK